jgi:hypothetical protein
MEKDVSIHVKGAPTQKSHLQSTVQIPCSSQSTRHVPSSYGSPPPSPPAQSPHLQDISIPPSSPCRPKKLATPHTQDSPKIPLPPPSPPRHPEKTEKLASPHPQDTPNTPSPPPTTRPEKKEKLASPHPQDTQNNPSPPPPPPPPRPPPPSPRETTKPTPPNESAQNNHAKAGAQNDVFADVDKSVDDISKKATGTSGPITSIIAPGETPPLLGKIALEKPSTISKQQKKETCRK